MPGRSCIGDPLADSTELGPLAFADQLEKVASYVKIGADEGATVLAGGCRPEGLALPGYYYAPTVLTDVNNDMRVVREEIFGPVAAIMPFEHEDELLGMANDTEYGLAAGVWTQNLSRAHRMARKLEAGTIWVNTYRAMSPMSPRQGFKNSRCRNRARPGVDERIHPAEERVDQHRRVAGRRPVRHALLEGKTSCR